MELYLIHFDRKSKSGAQHYIGATKDLKQRLADHRAGRGAKLLRQLNRAGIKYRVVRRWKNQRWANEKKLKALGHASLCPVCTGRAAYKRG